MENIFLKIKRNTETENKKKIHFNSGNYAYVCTRVKARRSFLLTEDIYLRLLAMDLLGVIRLIGENQYKKEINELIHKYSETEMIETALNKNLATSYNQILEFSKGDLQKMISAYLNRWNIWNIKTIVRGKLSNATSEEIMKVLIPLGKYHETYWKNIIENSNNIDEVIENLKENELYPLLVRLKSKYQDNFEFENKLEKEYYKYLLNSIPQNSKANILLINLIKSEIDLINFKTLFMTKYDNIESEKIIEMLIPDGETSINDLRILTDASDFKQFLNLLQKFSFYKIIKDEIINLEKTGDFEDIIRTLENEYIAKAKTFSYKYPLSILPVIDYFIRKKIEVDNLRIITKGKIFELNEEVIKDMLVI